MAKGENIFKRKDGRWEARYIKGYELSGKIKYGFCYGKTYREAKEKVTKCKAALVNGKPIPSTNSRHRFAFYCDEWLRMRKPKVKESTYIKYDTALRKHIKPKLGGCFPMGMTTGLIDDFTEELLFEDELAPKTVHDVLVVLHGILKYTATFFTGGFPAIEINYPKPGKKEMRVLSREEQTRFVSYLLDDMDTCKFDVLLTLFTGVRIGELCALQWGNISLKEQTIRIDATLQRLRDTSTADNPGSRTRIVIGTPKSDTSIRTIPITDYESLADGIIDRDEYARLKQNYAGRCAECEKQMDALQETITQIKEHGGEHREWMAQFREHLNITELERSIVVALIDRILIYKDNRVEVRFRFADEFAWQTDILRRSQIREVV